MEMFRRGDSCFLGYQFCSFLQFFLLDCDGNVQTGWYMFAKESILTISAIFLLDCCGIVQTGWYLFVKVSILTFSTILQMDCGGIFQTGGICLLGYQF